MALTIEQLKARRLGIGGSDIAPIFGLSSWKTPLDIYLEKVSTEEPYEPEEGGLGIKPKLWGSLIEPVLINHFENVTGHKCITGFKDPFIHPKYDFMRVNIDALLEYGSAILECKTAGQFKGKEWSPLGGDNIPEPYLLQCAYYAEVLDINKVYIAVLIGGNDFRIYHYNRNEQLGQLVLNKVIEFWTNHVEKQIPPEAISIEDSAKLWRDIISENTLTATSDIETTIQQMRALKAQKKAIEQQYAQKQLELATLVKDAQRVTDEAGNVLLTWKMQNFNSFNTQKFKADHPELYKEYIKTSQNRVLKLKGDIYE